MVTLSSASANIERSETIRVGYWKGSANPADLSVLLPEFPWAQAVNPVEPYAYSLYGGQVHVYHVYTGAEIATFDNANFQNIAEGLGYPISIEVNSDGTALYVANGATNRVVAIDAVTGAVLNTWNITPRFQSLDAKIRFTRVNGYPILITPLGSGRTEIIDLEAGTLLEQTSQGGQWFVEFESVRATSPDGSRLFTILGHSTSETVSQFGMVFGTLGGRALEISTAGAVFTQDNGFTRQMCITPSGTRLYTHNSASLTEIAIDVDPPLRLREIERPDYPGTSVQAIDCNWNGRLYVALQVFEGDLDNVMVFDADGTQVDSLLSGPLNSGVVLELMGLTGDSRRMVTTNAQVGDPAPLVSINFTNLP
jgi:DNA-binding beta-propeller fold protein YncE